jgi:hypothetical protein
MMGSGEQGVPICFTTFWAFALRLRTLNEIALPAVPTGTMLSAAASLNTKSPLRPTSATVSNADGATPSGFRREVQRQQVLGLTRDCRL